LADFRDNLFKTAIAPSLIDQIKNSAGPDRILPVIIDVSSEFPGGVVAARWLLVENYYKNHPPKGRNISPSAPPVPVRADLQQHWSTGRFQTADEMDVAKSLFTETYLFADLRVSTILNLVRDMGGTDPDGARVPHPIHKIWEDHEIQTFVYRSAQTIKCDASRIAFGTSGQDILWAVGDTGIDGAHPHFKLYDNLRNLPGSVQHYDFTRPYDDPDASCAAALTDPTGHGTHVAGIIAGRSMVGDNLNEVRKIVIKRTERRGFDETPAVPVEDTSLTEISGLAPQCKLLSLKVIEKAAPGATSNNVRNLIAAIGYIQQINGYGRDVKVHGLNLSVGYPFDPAWFAVGQSLLCVEVDRLVRCGVVVVVAAGNAGYGRVTTSIGTAESAALGCTIADPGNARLAITVGSTHRDQPHVYGVSYYSSKGPTADGRMKPDLVAPGERIVSCQAGAPGQLQADPNDVRASFIEDSGTSMAAPHVSGAIAGFLSVRREFRGRPEEVKDIFTGAATDLRRRPEFQGAGLIDMMRALQSV
jgi:serine protease AprX